MSDKMEGYTGSESGEGAIYREIWEEEIERLMAKGEGGRTTSALTRGEEDVLKSGIKCRANRQGQARIECGEINIHY